MKKLLLVFLLAVVVNYSFSQTTVQDVIKSELEELLIKGNILNSQEKNKELEEVTGRREKKKAKQKLDGDKQLRQTILNPTPDKKKV